MATSGAVHVAAVLAIHWVLGGTSLRVLPPPRGTVSIDLEAAWASAASGLDGESRKMAATQLLPAPDETAARELEARRLPLSPVGQLPPVTADGKATEAPQPKRLVATPAEKRPVDEPRMEEPPSEARPAFPRSRRAVRAGLDLDERRPTEASMPPSISARRSDGARTDAPPSTVFSPQPRYPPELLAARVTGIVKLRVRVGRDGRVSRASVYRSSGRQALDQAALDAVRRWRFEPARQAGIAIARDVIVPIRFTIQD